jgi:hypothetical protein
MSNWHYGIGLFFNINFRARDTTTFDLGKSTLRKMKVSNDGGIGIQYTDPDIQFQFPSNFPPTVVALEVSFPA